MVNLQALGDLPWYELIDCQVTAKVHYHRPGKPKPGNVPAQVSYHPQATLTLKTEKHRQYQRRTGRFVLAPNLFHKLHPTTLLPNHPATQSPNHSPTR